MVTRLKLWQESLKPGQKRLPVRIKKHSRFVGGHAITVLGTKWSRTWGVLPKGTRMLGGRPAWLGGLSWEPYKPVEDMCLKRPTIVLCKWRYR
jgi:hypothetical protein